MARERRPTTATRIRSAIGRARRALGALARPSVSGPNGICPVCGRPIRVFRPAPKMILLQPHPQELILACRNQNGTAHSRVELTRALERRRRAGPQTYTQAMADLEEQLGKREQP